MFRKVVVVGAALAALVGAAGTAHAGKDLDAVKARGALVCGVSTGVAGFSLADSQGKTSTFAGRSPRRYSAIPRR
jgi:general L-amino acid transport system substrate-binding protein